MREFDLLYPKTLHDALQALAINNAATRPLAGGTDMLVDLRSKRAQADVLVSLQAVSELRGVSTADGKIRIGAGTTIAEFLKHSALVQHEALRQAAFVFANPMIRNAATIAGNVSSASPAGDMLPPLLALDAQIELVSQVETRTLPLDQFFIAPRKTARRADELVTALTINPPDANEGEAFYKLGLRQADAISLISVAVWLVRDGDSIREVRIALGAVAPRPMRAKRAEESLRGQPFNETNIGNAAKLAADECAPIDDLRASGKYRRRMVGVYVRRMLEQAWSRAQ